MGNEDLRRKTIVPEAKRVEFLKGLEGSFQTLISRLRGPQRGKVTLTRQGVFDSFEVGDGSTEFKAITSLAPDLTRNYSLSFVRAHPNWLKRLNGLIQTETHNLSFGVDEQPSVYTYRRTEGERNRPGVLVEEISCLREESPSFQSPSGKVEKAHRFLIDHSQRMLSMAGK